MREAWLRSDSIRNHALFPSYMLMLEFQSVPLERGKKNWKWFTQTLECKSYPISKVCWINRWWCFTSCSFLYPAGCHIAFKPQRWFNSNPISTAPCLSVVGTRTSPPICGLFSANDFEDSGLREERPGLYKANSDKVPQSKHINQLHAWNMTFSFFNISPKWLFDDSNSLFRFRKNN